nr:hypothetical protein Iba_chr03bCG1980 [Ipomoea batatas]
MEEIAENIKSILIEKDKQRLSLGSKICTLRLSFGLLVAVLCNHKLGFSLSDDITDYLKDRGPKPLRWIGILGSDITMLFENLIQYRSITGFHLIAVNIHLFAIKDWESRGCLLCSSPFVFRLFTFFPYRIASENLALFNFWFHYRKCTGSIFMGKIVSHIYVVLVDLVTAKLCIARCILARNLGQIRGWSFSRAITA